MVFPKKQDIVDVDDSEIKDFKKLSWSDLTNYTILRVLKSESKEAFALEVDKLESIMTADLPNGYRDKLALIPLEGFKGKPYRWLKFDLLLEYIRKKAPKEEEGQL